VQKNAQKMRQALKNCETGDSKENKCNAG